MVPSEVLIPHHTWDMRMLQFCRYHGSLIDRNRGSKTVANKDPTQPAYEYSAEGDSSAQAGPHVLEEVATLKRPCFCC